MNVENIEETPPETPLENADEQSEQAETPTEEAPVEEAEDIASLRAQLQRVAADYANYQKRILRDRANWTRDAVRGVLSSMLPVIDNLDSAVKAFEGDVKDPETYKQGVVLVRDELLRQLANHTVARIEPEQGAAFDPDEHEAIMVQEVDGIDAQQVSFLARVGYRIKDTVLRPAQVGVMKPKPAPAAPAEPEAEA